MDEVILLLRLVIGIVMFAHGAQKLLGWFGGSGLGGTANWLETLGFRPGRLFAPFQALCEVGGGLLLALGLLTALATAAICGVMIVAMVTVTGKQGFIGGYELNLLVIVGAITVTAIGPGRYSLDHVLGIETTGLAWGGVAIGLGAAASVLTLLVRRTPA